jgi:hypothetical protein
VVAPWVPFWEHNRFAESRPLLQAIVTSPYARGGVTGVGIITALAGLAELGSLILSRIRRREPGPAPLDEARDRPPDDAPPRPLDGARGRPEQTP